MNNKRNIVATIKAQYGAATLFASLMLVILSSIAGIYASRSVLFEQKDSNNQYWATQANEVAQSGIEHAIAWLKFQYSSSGSGVAWVAPNSYCSQLDDRCNCPTGFTNARCFDMSNQSGVSVSNYTLKVALANDIIRSPNIAVIESRATNTSDNASATVTQKIYLFALGAAGSGLQGHGKNPPLVINGCTSDIKGNPVACPRNATGSPCEDQCDCSDGTCTGLCTCTGSCPGSCSGNAICQGFGTCETCSCNDGTGVGTAINSLRITDTNSDGSLSQSEIDACLDPGHLDIHDGQTTGTPVPPGTECNPDTAWTAIFGTMTKDQVKKISDAQLAAGLSQSSTPKRSVYWIDSGSNWHDDLGTAVEPAILIFSATSCSSSCPKVNGSPTIYGTVYFDSQCDETKMNGWGGAEIHGSVVVESDLAHITANGRIHYNPNTRSAFPNAPTPATVGGTGNNIQRISGSWKDF